MGQSSNGAVFLWPLQLINLLGGAYVTGAEEAPCAPLFVGEGGAGDDDSVLEAIRMKGDVYVL